eukprot:scaffold397_cov395-Pavlova_lutheri.AAC.4
MRDRLRGQGRPVERSPGVAEWHPTDAKEELLRKERHSCVEEQERVEEEEALPEQVESESRQTRPLQGTLEHPIPELQDTMPNPEDHEHGVLDREQVGRIAEDLDEDLVPRGWQEDSERRDDRRLLIEICAQQQLMMRSMVNMQQELTRALQL